MPTCNWCGRSGIFLHINNNGLCQNCNPFIKLDIQNRIRILSDSLELVKTTKKLDTLILRLNLILEHSQSLSKYEEKGIPTIQPPPSKVYQDFQLNYDNIIIERIEIDLQEKLKNLDIPSVSPRVKLNQLSKILTQINDIEPKLHNPEIINPMRQKISSQINQIQLNSYLEDAEKAEFKGKKKIALDNYYEALYFLQHDKIDDSLQQSDILRIKSKILELGGTINQ